MAIQQTLKPGTRVRLTAVDRILRLRSDTGRILELSKWAGYYVVRLDAPAILDEQTGELEEIRDIVQDEEEIEVLDG